MSMLGITIDITDKAELGWEAELGIEDMCKDACHFSTKKGK